jgi:DNA-binding NtrC family response regulator
MPLSRRVLVIDEDTTARRLAAQALGGAGFKVAEASSGRSALIELRTWTPDCVLVALGLTDIPALQLVKAIASEVAPRPPVVVIGERPTFEVAVEAMKLGAKDVVSKPMDAERLKVVVLGAIERSDLARDVARLETILGVRSPFEPLVTKSAAMNALVEKLDRLASVEMPILFVGERGSGCAAAARRLHAIGPRSSKPFVVVPESSAEQVLFGGGSRPSAFAHAGDGSIFIESLESLGKTGQDRLATVLSEVGAAKAGGQAISFPRILVGSERELASLVELGLVKDELARRLSPLTVHVPSLKDRKEDIADLITQITERVARESRTSPIVFEADAIAYFEGEPWPGNVRELEAAVIRASVLARNGRVRLADLAILGAPRQKEEPRPATLWMPVDRTVEEVLPFERYEAEIFRFALDRAGGCVSHAAELLGVGRATMYRKMRDYGIEAPPVEERSVRPVKKRVPARRPMVNEQATEGHNIHVQQPTAMVAAPASVVDAA